MRHRLLINSVYMLLAMLTTSAMAADLITGLGNPPVTTENPYTNGFGENAFTHDNDQSRAVDVTSVFPTGIRFGGVLHTTMYINSHGNVTFEQPAGADWIPQQIQANATLPRIAIFFADTDTRVSSFVTSPGGTSKGSNLIYWDLDPVKGIITVTWDDVGYYRLKSDKVNAYQLRLIRIGNDGEFDIEFRYEAIGWTTGDGPGNQQGTNGYGGIIARAGYTASDGLNFYELPQSGKQGSISTLTLDPPGIDLAIVGGMLDLAQLTNCGIPGVFVFQIRRPVVAITPNGVYTNANPILFTFRFDSAVTGFTAADLSVTNGTLGTLTTITAGLVYQMPITPTAEGNVVITVAAGGANNLSGNGNLMTSATAISDQTPPTVVSITPTGLSEVNTADVPFVVTFSEPMINLVAADFTSSNGSPLSLSGSGTTWTVTIRSTGDGALNLTLPMASCTDRAGNTLAADGTASVTVDATGPSVTVTHSPTATLTNSLAPITFTIDFSSVVTGFVAGDIAVSNGTAGAFTVVSGTSYTQVVTPTTDGLVTLTVPASVALDSDGLGNYAGSKSLTLDRLAPTVTIAPTGAVISTDGVFTFTFSEPMTGLDAADFTITNGSIGTPTLVPGTTATYRATITASGAGNVGISVNAGAGLTDRAGNPLAGAATATVTFTVGLASLAISTTATEPTIAATIPVTFTFAATAAGFTASDVAISNGTPGTLVDAGGGVFTMAVTPSAGGLVTIAVAAGACTVGAVGNESASLTVNHLPSGPVATFTVAPTNGAYPGQAMWVTITFNEDVTGLTDLELVIPTGFVTMFSSIDARTYQALVTINPRPNNAGTLSLAGGVASGANSRPSQGSSIDLMAPYVAPVIPTPGGERTCGLGSGLALLLLWLVAGLTAGPRFARRRE